LLAEVDEGVVYVNGARQRAEATRPPPEIQRHSEIDLALAGAVA
jgi:hypothetical protein